MVKWCQIFSNLKKIDHISTYREENIPYSFNIHRYRLDLLSTEANLNQFLVQLINYLDSLFLPPLQGSPNPSYDIHF